VKELLSRAGVPFEVRNVETDLAAYRDLLDRGFRTVPVTLVGDDPSPSAIIGFNESALKTALDLA
jgi:glutaredoxin